jgi:hypothetical protein
LRRTDHSSKESCLCKNDHETEKETRAQQGAVEPLKKKNKKKKKKKKAEEEEENYYKFFNLSFK